MGKTGRGDGLPGNVKGGRKDRLKNDIMLESHRETF